MISVTKQWDLHCANQREAVWRGNFELSSLVSHAPAQGNITKKSNCINMTWQFIACPQTPTVIFSLFISYLTLAIQTGTMGLRNRRQRWWTLRQWIRLVAFRLYYGTIAIWLPSISINSNKCWYESTIRWLTFYKLPHQGLIAFTSWHKKQATYLNRGI